MDLNKSLLIGRLTGRPELRVTQTGRSVATFTVVTNRKYKSQEIEQSKATFHKVVVWGKTAEFASEFMDKGSKVFVEGVCEQNDYTDKQGNKRKNFEIIASNVIALDRVQSTLENNNNEFKINHNPPEVNKALESNKSMDDQIEDAFDIENLQF